MIDEVLFTLLGLLLAFQVGMMLALRRCESLLHTFDIALKTSSPDAAVEAMREEVGDIVNDVLASMRPPSIADHLGGVLSQWAQIRMMREVQQCGVLPDAMAAAIDDEPRDDGVY